MRRRHGCLILAAVASLVLQPFLGAEEGAAPAGLRLSVTGEAGWLAFGDATLALVARDWYARSGATLGFARDEGAGACAARLRTTFDAATGTWALSLDEAWMALRPLPLLEARLGRFAIAYGPCLAFNPANFLATKNALDPRSAARGLDGLSLGVRPIPLGGEGGSPPLATLLGALVLPSPVSPNLLIVGDPLADLEVSSLHGRMTIVLPAWGLLGETELGIAGDLRDLGRAWRGGAVDAGQWDAGTWLSADLGGFVLGAEGGSDSAGLAWALSLNRGFGDWLALAELSRTESPGDWKAFLRLSRSLDRGALSLSSLVDFESLAARSVLEASLDIGDSFVLRASLTWNRLPEKWEPALPATWAAAVAMECYP